MTVIDILFRVDEICKKYDKYDAEKQSNINSSEDDACASFEARVEEDVELPLMKSDEPAVEKNRSVAFLEKESEIRRAKGRLLEEVKELGKLAKKKVF